MPNPQEVCDILPTGKDSGGFQPTADFAHRSALAIALLAQWVDDNKGRYATCDYIRLEYQPAERNVLAGTWVASIRATYHDGHVVSVNPRSDCPYRAAYVAVMAMAAQLSNYAQLSNSEA